MDRVWIPTERFCTSVPKDLLKIFVKVIAALFVELVPLKQTLMMNIFFLNGYYESTTFSINLLICPTEQHLDTTNILCLVVNHVTR
jgi:hypothetical protein